MSPSRFPLALAAFALAFATLATSACYDHRVTQAIMERRRRAKEAEGAKLRSAGSVMPNQGVKTGRLRFYVSQDYRQQHKEWRAPLLSLVNSVNDLTTPNFAVRFEVASMNEWSPSCAPTQLHACLDELKQLDPGEDGDWVVGVLGAMPSFTASFDDLGMAHVPGRHFIVRDVSDLAEREAIERAFATHTAARRDEIYQRRKAHKRLAVFLHEWAHSMGALHVESNESLLHPAYDDRMQSFDEANQGVIEAGLRDRFRYSGQHDELTAYLQGDAARAFPPEAREALLARLTAATEATTPALTPNGHSASRTESGVAPRSPKHAFVVDGSEEELLSALEPEARDSYRDAVRLTLKSDTLSALKVIEPVAERYPQNYAVQHLACGLAMQTGYQSMASKSCARVSALASGK